MSEPVIVLDHIYKKFTRGELHTSLRDYIPALARRLWQRARGQGGDRNGLGEHEFWAVEDVSFQLTKGQTLGIVGPNGSGKSTTLKLLSGILRPDGGQFSVRGRLSALIEVGAGFHPDLTGRENVYLNGCILGMTRKEVAAKFNRIVEFAGVEDFIDTPVKRYSSGMAVRLGFAVAAFIEPEVLLVDEVLAVGDAEFRSRCHDRMEQMRREGVTMILVSHNTNEIRTLCEQTLMLYRGQVVMTGPTQKVLEKYHQAICDRIFQERAKNMPARREERAKAEVVLTGVQLLNSQGEEAETFGTGQGVTIRMGYEARRRVERPNFTVQLMWAAEDYEATLFSTQVDAVELEPLEGQGTIDLRIPSVPIEPNVYKLRIQVGDATGVIHDTISDVRFVLSEELPVPGIFILPHEWKQTRQPLRQGAAAGRTEACRVA